MGYKCVVLHIVYPAVELYLSSGLVLKMLVSNQGCQFPF